MSIQEWILANGNGLQFALFLALFPLLAVAERLIPRVAGPGRIRDRWPANLGLTVLNVAVLSVLPVSLITAAAWGETNRFGVLQLVNLPLPLAIVANLLGRGFISFFVHFLMHKVPLFWRLHRVHHLDTALDVSTTVRFHPLEFLIQLPIGVALVLALGLSPWLLMVYELLDAVITLFSHANLRLPAGVDRVLRYLIVTPDLHRVHHSSWQPETDSNFGAVFPVWDLVFRTFRAAPRDGFDGMRIGLDEVRGDRTGRFWWLLLSPLRRVLPPDGAADSGTWQPSVGVCSS